jgi:tRNA nucleotidyltransferase/poly(A) polymerase
MEHPQKRRVKFIMSRLETKGFRALIAGGAVRDTMLGRMPEDIDILTDAPIEELESLFCDQKFKIVGRTFPVCLVNGIELAPCRSDSENSEFPESDLAKRDFTINAMAFDPVEEKIFDPFNGRKDLEDGIIRFTCDPEKRVREDPVRMVRACRFAALLKGSFSLSALDIIMRNRDLIAKTAGERIYNEIIRALALEKPSLFFMALRETGLLAKIFPSLDRCFCLDGGPHHGETVFEHCLLVGDALASGFPMLRLAGFLHDAGKFDAANRKKGHLSFEGHENHVGAVLDDLVSLRAPKQDIDFIIAMIKCHMRPLNPDTGPRAARRLLAALDGYGISWRDFMRMRIADRKGNLARPAYTISQIKARVEVLLNELRDDNVFKMKNLNINGRDIQRILSLPRGPEIGRIKRMLFEKVLDNPELNTPDILEKLCLSLLPEK